MKRNDRPDGILATGEKLTPTIYLVCKDLQLQIPHHVKAVIFSNLQTASILNPSLTTIVQPAFEMGQVATELLITLIESKRAVTEFEKMVLQTELIVRDSSAKKCTENQPRKKAVK